MPQALIALLCLLLCACSSRAQDPPPAIPAAGQLAGERLQTRVDSDAARYLLEDYLQGRRQRPSVDAALAALDRQRAGALPTRAQLHSLTRQFSTDFAALYFAEAVLAQPHNRRFNVLFREEVERIRAGRISRLPDDAPSRVLYVPGWLYRSDPGTGADLRESRQANTAAGLESVLVEVPESGSIESNAAELAEAIVRHSAQGRLLTLASASKGGPEVLLALTRLQHEGRTHGVRLWINVGGLLQGSPLADFGMRWPWRWLAWAASGRMGWNLPSIASMQTEPRRRAFAGRQLPENLLVVNYLGVPMAANITPRAHQGYQRMRRDGPNDGLTLLPDAVLPEGLTLLALGQDHFMINRDPKTEALALPRALQRWLAQSPPGAP